MARPPSRSVPPRAVDGRRVNQRRSAAEPLRAAAAWVVERTLASQAMTDAYLPGVLERFEERDQRLVREIVLGTLRWLRRLDHVLTVASSRPLDQIEPALLATLRVAVYQLLFLDRVPSHAIVDEAVESAHQKTHRGAVSFVNAVLRRIAKERTLEAWPVTSRDLRRRMAIELSHPDFLVEGWVDRFGLARTRRLLEANNQPRPMQLLAFSDRGGNLMLAERMIEEGIEVEPSRRSSLGLVVRDGNPLRTTAFAEGDAYVADELSQATAWIPPLRPGERVVEVAAAPGGKTFAMLAREPSARIVAGDVDLGRLLRMRENLQRLGRSVPLVCADGRSVAFASASFDRVVADLPCSGTGTLRKHPELKWRLAPEDLPRLANRGFAMVGAAAELVAPGGLLIAITCSIEAVENEDVVERLLAHNDDFAPEPLAGALPAEIADGIEAPGRWRLLPDDEHDGFTVHVLRRR